MQDNKYITTKERLEKLKKELEILKEKRKEIAKRLKEAMSFGDLSENAEYQDAKDEQALLETKIAELQDFIDNAIIVGTDRNKNMVSLGSIVEVGFRGKKNVFEIVEPGSGNPLEGKISIDSPIGKALVSKKVGDIVEIDTPQGKISYKILKIS